MRGFNRIGWVSGFFVLLGCTTVESDGATTFATAAASGASSPGSGSESGEASEGTSEDGDDASDTSGHNPSDEGSSTGGPSSADAPATDGDEGMNDEGGGQPAVGMYAHCLAPEQCAGGPINVCITINDNQTGFCTNSTCSNPALDCDPSPGGTAEPMCYPITLNNMPAQSCALDCSAGKVCPVGMQCFALEGGLSVCA